MEGKNPSMVFSEGIGPNNNSTPWRVKTLPWFFLQMKIDQKSLPYKLQTSTQCSILNKQPYFQST